MSTIIETIDRNALIAFSTQYSSVAHALMELIDNPFDYRKGRHLTVEVQADKTKDYVEVLDFGGEGMDDEGLAEWIKWGSGREHSLTDIGQYHVGGKLAAMYLADEVDIQCRKAGQNEIWRFRDSSWGSRTDLYSGELERVRGQLPARIAEIPTRVGFTRVRLSRLKEHRYNISDLERELSSTYRSLLSEGMSTITINGREIQPLATPVSNVFDPIRIEKTKLRTGITVRGEIYVIDRDRIPNNQSSAFKAGVRTVFNGRLITSGEEFSYYLSGRGPLQRLLGEIHLERIRPNTTKTDWNKDSLEWRELSIFMREQMQPAIAFLNQQGERKTVSRELRKKAALIRRRVVETFRKLAESGVANPGILAGEYDAPGGRKPPKTRKDGGGKQDSGSRSKRIVKKRTPPPSNAVGRLLRRYKGGIPEIEFDDLGKSTPRTQWRDNGKKRHIVINTGFPMFPSIGETEDYLFEAVVLHLLDDLQGDQPFRETLARLDQIVWAAEETS